ncbi:MAG: hypothetical protein GY707_12490 [Desulfobacteraceae bacterium]|nr:hypothetical protein [Desulfobacteraceae bacterium]
MICSDGDNLKSKLLAKWFPTILIIVTCIFLATSQGSTDPILKSVGKLKAFEKKKYKAPIVTVSVPVKIMNLPEPWRDADLVVMANVIFYAKGKSWTTGMTGFVAGMVIKSQPFKNGSSQGMVNIPLYELQGAVTGQYITGCYVLATLGDQAKVLGTGWHFPSGSGGLSTEQKEFYESLVDKVGTWDGTMKSFI